ncbi:MAG: hypothetical protein WCQ70_02705 [Lentimicrobiaceae bacterium]
MRNKSILLFLALILVAGVFNACKKDNLPVSNTGQVNSNDKINQLLGNFTDKYATFKSGKWLKSSEKIDFDSVMWYIDGAINFNYASGLYSFEKIHKDTIYVEVPVDPDMKSLLTNVFESYDESLIRIGEKYYANTGEYKKFIMATVSDAGPLPYGKRKLRIATLTGTGLATQSGDFGNGESYRFNRDAEYNCNYQPVPGAPLVFEAKLLDHFNTVPPTGCRYYYVGTPTIVEYDYEDYRINPNVPLTNYLDYKIFAAHEYITTFNDDILCLEYDQWGMGIHEMQFYYDNLVDLANVWIDQQGNVPYPKSFAEAEITSLMYGQDNNKTICHLPKFFFKLKIQSCDPSNPYFPTE